VILVEHGMEVGGAEGLLAMLLSISAIDGFTYISLSWPMVAGPIVRSSTIDP
jgi:hypothetical protein